MPHLQPFELCALEDAVLRSGEWGSYCAETITGLKLTVPSERTRAAAALFHLSTSHQAAIHVLASTSLYGPAFALFRPQVETHERGLWLHKGATEEQLTAFLNGKRPPSRRTMLESLPAEKRLIDKIISPEWEGLCDFTHGGKMQVAARITKVGIDEQFAEPRVAAMLMASCTLLLATMMEILDLCTHEPSLPNNALQAFNRTVVAGQAR